MLTLIMPRVKTLLLPHRQLLLALLVCLLLVSRALVADTLMPRPLSVNWGEGQFVLEQPLVLRLDGKGQQRLQRGMQRWRQQLQQQTGRPVELTPAVGSAPAASLSIQLTGDSSRYPQANSSESYSLSVKSNGITLTADSVFGALHGLVTLRQLAVICGAAICFPSVDIVDEPRFKVRGVLIDPVRHWIPVDVIKRQLDAMAEVKLNLLHWHLSDDQGFRVESLVLPRLHEVGSDGNYYTQADVRDIVEYAADRGIRVMPEFDLPGHSRSWQIAYPDMASRPRQNYQLYSTGRFFSDPIDPTKAVVYKRIEAVVAEMSGLFPDKLIHLGGDEVSFDAWQDNRAVGQFMQANNIDSYEMLQAYFIQRYAAIVSRYGKTPVAWQDALNDHLPDTLVLQTWLPQDLSPKAYQHEIIVSTNYYLDHVLSAEHHYRNNILHLTIDGSVDARLANNVTGVIAAAWSETMDEHNIDSSLWPRLAAIAERLWSAAEFTNAADIDFVYWRMEAVSQRLEQVGVRHHQNQWLALQALASQTDVEQLYTLATVLEPKAFYTFRDWQFVGSLLPWFGEPLSNKPTELRPFTRSLQYESLAAWHFNRRVESFLKNPEDAALATEIRQQLQAWSDSAEHLQKVIEGSEQLRELGVGQLADIVQQMADIGLAALAVKLGEQTLEVSELKKNRRFLKTYRKVPMEYSYRYLWYSLKQLLKPEAVRVHSFAIAPGVSRLLE